MRQAHTRQPSAPSWRVWLFIVCLAHGLDIVTTVIGLRMGLTEGNPLMGTVLQHSELSMYALKISAISGLILIVRRLRHRYRLLWRSFQIVHLLFFLVIVGNLSQIVLAIG